MTDTDLQFGGYGAAVTVETGAGLPNADSYLSLIEATARIGGLAVMVGLVAGLAWLHLTMKTKDLR